MKTRIKVIEYNSGKKEFVCEYGTTIPVKYYLHPLMWIFIFLLLFDDWDTMTIVDKQDANNNKKAIFNTIEEAKKFIDDYLLVHNAEKEKVRQAKVKKWFAIKHP